MSADVVKAIGMACLAVLGGMACAAMAQQQPSDRRGPRIPATMVAAFQSAKSFDPQFRGALAEKTVNDAAVTTSRLAYTPTASYTYQQLDIEASTRKTFQITQPIVNADRYFSFREAQPRAQFAEATLVQREQDLAQRLLKAVTELVRAREAARANGYRISMLEEQANRARRMYQLDEGTITDMRDTAVQLDQAKATQFSLNARVDVAEKQYAAIVGTPPGRNAYRIIDKPQRFPLDAADRYVVRGQGTNPALVTARQNEILAESAAKRAKASLLPTIAAVYIQTESAGRSASFTGTALQFPLQGQTLAQISSAGAQAEKAREQVRQTEQQVKVDIERLRALVDSGEEEWASRKDAIASAELAVQANLKSQQGGIRTSLEVLNAIETLANVRNDYANTAATLAENYLSLLLQSAYDATDALQTVQEALFER